jgi:hypothetical protein
VEQLRTDINPPVVNGLTQTELGVWVTPEGTAYVDGIGLSLRFKVAFELIIFHSFVNQKKYNRRN